MTTTDLPPKMKKVLRDLSPGEAEALLACLRDPQDSAQRIADVLTRHGHPIGCTTVKQARKVMLGE